MRINTNNTFPHSSGIASSASGFSALAMCIVQFELLLYENISANYINNFITNNDEDVFLMTKKIINGHNPNEVKLVNKTRENKGFFEKFFNFLN